MGADCLNAQPRRLYFKLVGGTAVSGLPKIEPNFIDRLVTYVNPAAGLERQKSRTMLAINGSYTGARYDRRPTQNWYTTNGSPDADTLADIPVLRSRSRDMARNAPLAGGAINTLVLNAVGTGLALQPTPDRNVLGWEDEAARAWAQSVAHEFGLWAESQNCDVTRTNTFYEAQGLALRSKLESGDLFVLLPMVPHTGGIYDTRFQLVEADRVADPNGFPDAQTISARDGTALENGNRVIGGVEVDSAGAPVAYWVLPQHPGSVDWSRLNENIAQRVIAFGAKTGRRNVLHLFDRVRPDQTRGVPYLAPVIETLKQLDRYTEAEVAKAVIQAAFTVFVTSDTGETGIPGEQYALPPAPGALTLGNGKILGLQPGQDVTFPAATSPNSAFDPFVTSLLRQVGVALEIPFEVLIKHFTSSYSAARASLLEAWKFYRNRRNFLAIRFCQPIFEAWMDEAVVLGRVKAPGYFSDPLLRRAYLSADWIGDAPGAIDPLKEAQAAKLRCDEGFSSLTIETMELTGRNWNDVHPQRVREHALRSAADLEPGVLNTTATEMVPDDNQDDADATPPPVPGQEAPTNGPPAAAPKGKSTRPARKAHR